MKKYVLGLIALLIVALTLGSAFAQEECIDCCEGECGPESADTDTLDLYTCTVEVNGDEVFPDDVGPEVVERGEELDIKVRLEANQDMEDVQITAILTGYHRKERLVDMTRTFDLEANDRDSFYLTLKIPEDWDIEKGEDDVVMLRILVTDDSHDTFDEVYKLRFEPKRDSVVIRDIILDPYGSVEAGRGLFVSVRVKNMGENDEEGLKVTASIPALGLKATEYIDELEEDESTTSEDMFLRIPSCTESGEYVLRATVVYADGDEEVSEQTTIEILADPECGVIQPGKDEKTVVTVPGKQDVIKGTSGTVYPIILENRGVTDRSYELTASGLDTWATYRFDPGTFVLLSAGETQTVYLYVTPKEDAPEGEKVFMVSVETAGDQKQVALTANVLAGDSDSVLGDWDKVKKGLEIGLIVLVVLLVVLILIIGFNKLKGDEEPEEISGQTYY